MHELRMAWRRTVRRPWTAALVVLTLSISIGTAAATWAVMSAVLLRPLPIANADLWHVIGQRETGSTDANVVRHGFIYSTFTRIQSNSPHSIIGMWNTPQRVSLSHGTYRSDTSAVFVSGDFFSALAIGTPLGRGLIPQDDRADAPIVAVLSDAFWRTSFNADPYVVGKQVTVSGRPATIVGVATPVFRGLDLSLAPDLYMPLGTVGSVGSPLTNYFAAPSHASSPTAGMRMMVRAARGESLSRLAAQLSPLLGSNEENRALTELIPLHEAAIPVGARPHITRFVRLLVTTVFLLLLIGAVTVGLMMVIAINDRESELATLRALGAPAHRLFMGVVSDLALVSLVAGLAAVPLASALLAGFRSYQLPGSIMVANLHLPSSADLAWPALTFTVLAVSVVVAIVGAFGFVARSSATVSGVSSSGTRATSRRHYAFMSSVQVAVALVLLLGATLFGRSLQTALSLNSQIDGARLSSGQITLPSESYSPATGAVFFEKLTNELLTKVSVEAVSFSAPLGGMTPAGSLTVNGEPTKFPSTVRFVAVDESYLPALGLIVRPGQQFPDATASAGSEVVVSSSMARRLGGETAAIGQRLTVPRFSGLKSSTVARIVGVVPDVVTDVSVLEPLVVYLPIDKAFPPIHREMFLRARSEATQVEGYALAAIRTLDPLVRPTPIMTFRARIASQMGPQQLGVAVLGAFAGVALLLTALGTYILAESMTSSRKRELGIRAALGATAYRLRGEVLWDSAKRLALGTLAGLILVGLGARMIRGLLFEVSPLDLASLFAVLGILVCTTLLGAIAPAIRASNVDLATVLRQS